MTDIPPPAQDLAVIDRAGDLALAFDLVTEEFAEILDRLRGCIARDAQDAEVRARDLAVGDAFARRRWSASDVHSDEAKTEVGSDIRAAIASLGAEIVWPSPEVGEGGSGSAAGGTAPETSPPTTDTASTTHRQCQQNPACAAPAGHKTPCWVLTNVTVTEASEDAELTDGDPMREHVDRRVREKILAEVAGHWSRDHVPDGASTDSVIDSAFTIARTSAGTYQGREVRGRDNLLAAASMLIGLFVRLDGGR